MASISVLGRGAKAKDEGVWVGVGGGWTYVHRSVLRLLVRVELCDGMGWRDWRDCSLIFEIVRWPIRRQLLGGLICRGLRRVTVYRYCNCLQLNQLGIATPIKPV